MIRVEWRGGPHDGTVQFIFDPLPDSRVCECHGALYVTDPFDPAVGYILRFALPTVGRSWRPW